jgi:uncharacterized protein (DUF362 family)/NAD-dependent dihydropyrimidine dehydrogenase PreA subunit
VGARARVLIRRADYGDGSVEKAVEEIFESFGVDVTGRKVLIKPNMLSARTPGKGVTTHPEIVRAAVAAVKRRRAADIWVGDNPGMRYYGDSEEAAVKTGIREASQGHYRHLGRSPVTVRLHNPYVQQVTISREVLDCDYLITLPKFKTHSLTVLTCAVKNSYGFLLGAEKARLHRIAASPRAFARTVVDIWNLRRPDLAILDAVTAMQGNGPSCRDVFHYGHLVAAEDSVALDTVAAALMGLNAEEVPTTADAAGRGFGISDRGLVDIDGPFAPIEGFKLPSTMLKSPLAGFLARLMGGLVVSQPHCDTNGCVRCGLCKDHCPTEAIRLDPFPKIARRKCIRCYCCLEFCPYDAMKLSRRVRFLRGFGR